MESKGRNKDFFDEIIDSLRSCEEESPVSYVARDILLEFYRPVPKLSSGRKISAPSARKLLSPPPAGTLEQRLDPSFEKVRQNNAAATAATAAASSERSAAHFVTRNALLTSLYGTPRFKPLRFVPHFVMRNAPL